VPIELDGRRISRSTDTLLSTILASSVSARVEAKKARKLSEVTVALAVEDNTISEAEEFVIFTSESQYTCN
jgi:hypothetical protein